MTITFTALLNIAGLILGVVWFGWWFLIPAILVGIKITNAGKQI